MTILEALWLGLVQGLTEFLPVSSSAHLVFFQHLLGLREPLLFFDVILHLGTLAAILVYFAKDVAQLIRDSIYGFFFVLRRMTQVTVTGDCHLSLSEYAPHAWTVVGILIATIPAALAGFFLHDWFESLFGSLRACGIALLGTSLILGATRGFEAGEKPIEKARLSDFFLIGILQALAIIPGISRSGATIAAGLFRGLTREAAFRFSFLLAIPAILGAGILEFRKGTALLNGNLALPATVGFVVAAVSGYFALYLLSRIVQKGRLHLFGLYTLAVGLAILFLSRWLE